MLKVEELEVIEGHKQELFERELKAVDRCDSCPARAYFRVLMRNGGELLFCVHHANKHETALREQAVFIQDDRHLLSSGV